MDEAKNTYVDNFIIYDVNMEYYKELWYTKDSFRGGRMNQIWENIKEILEREVCLLIENSNDIIQLAKEDSVVRKKIVDHRFELLKQLIASAQNKDKIFYKRLVQVISVYINKLCDRDIDFCDVKITSTNEELDCADTIYFNCMDEVEFKQANRQLSKHLFNYVCSILEKNKDIKLDIETLGNLLNRNPKQLSFLVEKSVIYRNFDFERLTRIINESQTLEQSNISIEEIYQLLLDTCQLNNEEVFGNLVRPEQFKQNHNKIDEILMWCDAKAFVEITTIIRRNFDEKFDIISYAKKRNENHFCERLIIELLSRYTNKEDYELIHDILTDSEINIDYDLYASDFTGQTDLKSLIALSCNRTIVRDLIEQDHIQNYYHHGEYVIPLYILYAIIGEYEKALANFEQEYHFEDDLSVDFDITGYAYSGWSYMDSLAEFINKMCSSFKEDNTDYSMIINLIDRIVNNRNVKYMNLYETLPPLKDVLSPDDFELLINNLIEKYNLGSLSFISVHDNDSVYNRYLIRVIKLNDLKDNEKGKNLILTKKDGVKY